MWYESCYPIISISSRRFFKARVVSVDRLTVAAPDTQGQAARSNSGQQAQFGSAAHDGRSAGGYQQEHRRGRERPENEMFARLFQQSRDKPIDLVA